MTFLSCAIWKRHEMTKCSQGKTARVNSQCKMTWDSKRAGMAGSDQGQTALNKSKHIILQWGTAKSFSTARGDTGAGLDLRSAIPLGTKALQRSNNQMCPVFLQVHRIKNISNYTSAGDPTAGSTDQASFCMVKDTLPVQTSWILMCLTEWSEMLGKKAVMRCNDCHILSCCMHFGRQTFGFAALAMPLMHWRCHWYSTCVAVSCNDLQTQGMLNSLNGLIN